MSCSLTLTLDAGKSKGSLNTEYAEKRLSGKSFELVTELPVPHTLERGVLSGVTWLGTYTVHDARRYWFAEKQAIASGGLVWSPGQFARDWLKTHKLKPAKAFSQQLMEFGYHTMPLVAKPGRYKDHAYVDLKSAYWQIINVMGWNVDYWPGLWLRSGRPCTDFPLPGHKQARNALVGAAIMRGSTRVWWQGRYQWRKMGNPYRNQVLWAAIQDVLHSVAWYTVTECDAVYVNTDGYIVPAQKVDQLMDWLRWNGLDAAIKKEGDATINGVGDYRIGDYKTIRANRTSRIAFNLNPYVRDGWTLARFRKLSHYR